MLSFSVISKMQKRTLRFDLIQVRMAVMKKHKRWRRWGGSGPSTVLVGMEAGPATVEIHMAVPQTTKIRASIWPILTTPECLYLKGSQSACQRHACIHVYWTLFTATKLWTQLRCPLTGQ